MIQSELYLQDVKEEEEKKRKSALSCGFISMPKWKCTIGYSVGLSLNVCVCVCSFSSTGVTSSCSRFLPHHFYFSVVVFVVLLFCLIYRMCPRFNF